MRALVSVSIVTVAVCLASPAAAEQRGSLDLVMELDRRAQAAFGREQYAESLAALRSAQELVPSSARLFNMAVCEERLGNHAAAVALLEQFVAAPETTAEQRTVATARLTTLREQLEPSGPDPEPEPEPEPDPEPEPAPHAEPEPRGRAGLPPAAFFASLGATAALGITMGVLGGVTLAREAEFLELERGDDRVADLQQEGQSLTTATNVFLGLTAAAAATTLVLVFFTRWGGEEEPAMALAPSFDGTCGQLTVSGRF